MAYMGKKVCLDTDICIAILNADARAEKFREASADAELFASSISVFELYLRKENLNIVSNFLNNLPILHFNKECAIKASEVYKVLEKQGKLLEFRDIFIASIAIVNNCNFATFNKKHFSRIKELKLLDF